MTIRAWRTLSIALFLASLCGSCAVPRFDVPYVEGTPSATSIVRRLEYELLDLVREDTGNQHWLLTDDYQVAVTLSLEVNDTGGLAPSASYMNPLSKVASFAFGGSGTLSESRDHNFTENLQFSFREIYKDWQRIPTAYPPPVADTNRFEIIASCGEVNNLIGRLLGEALPTIDLAHHDLPRGQQCPEEHRRGLRTRQYSLGLDPPLEFLVQAFDGVRGSD